MLVELIVAVRFEPAQSQLCGRVRKCPYRATHSAGQITEDYHEGLRTNIGNVSTLDNAVAAFNRTERRKGKTIIRVHP